MSYGRDRTLIKATIDISVSTTISDEVNVGPLTIVGIIMPAGWTAADIAIHALTLQTEDPTPVLTFTPIVDDAGTAIVLAAAPAAGEYVAIKPAAQLTGLGRIKLVTSVGQGADRVVTLVCV